MIILKIIIVCISLKERAGLEIEREKQKAEHEIKKQAVDLAVELSVKALGQQIKQIAERLRGLRDALDISIENAAQKCNILASDYAKYDNSTCEWNKFLKDFCADERNTQFKNKSYY